MIGQLHSVVLDAPDPHALATSSAGVLGREVEGAPGDDRRKDPTAPHDALRTPQAPAAWPGDRPDPDRPQQFHLDIRVADVEAADPQVLARDARRLPGGGDFRVCADPVGHPFCLVWDARAWARNEP